MKVWESARMHISKLKCFDGTQDAKEIENCFKVARVEEEAKGCNHALRG